ncbi:MAG: transposase, partial [Chitinophagales bacterium]|nr:transposase [Chitinophagales bacterium]MCG8331060.1 transposase [Chitinophagales bacterium]
GLAPRTFESGKSVRGTAHICKLGSAFLRKILYQCSLSAKRFNPSCKQVFDRLRRNGKPFKIAMIAVANKLIKIAFAIAKSGKAYDPNFAMADIKK